MLGESKPFKQNQGPGKQTCFFFYRVKTSWKVFLFPWFCALLVICCISFPPKKTRLPSFSPKQTNKATNQPFSPKRFRRAERPARADPSNLWAKAQCPPDPEGRTSRSSLHLYKKKSFKLKRRLWGLGFIGFWISFGWVFGWFWMVLNGFWMVFGQFFGRFWSAWNWRRPQITKSHWNSCGLTGFAAIFSCYSKNGGSLCGFVGGKNKPRKTIWTHRCPSQHQEYPISCLPRRQLLAKVGLLGSKWSHKDLPQECAIEKHLEEYHTCINLGPLLKGPNFRPFRGTVNPFETEKIIQKHTGLLPVLNQKRKNLRVLVHCPPKKPKHRKACPSKPARFRSGWQPAARASKSGSQMKIDGEERKGTKIKSCCCCCSSSSSCCYSCCCCFAHTKQHETIWIMRSPAALKFWKL